MKMLIVSRLFLAAALILGLLVALIGGTPQGLAENSTAIGGACYDCWDTGPETCAEASSKSECTDTTEFEVCRASDPDDGICTKIGEVTCAANCRISPNNEECKK